MHTDELAERALSLIPKLDIAYDGNCSQALGIDLPIAVINLTRRADRWLAVSSRMAAIGIDKLIKVPAVEGAQLSLSALAPLLGQSIDIIEAPPRSHFTLTRPAIGCFLSHLGVWNWIIENKLPRVLIFEDDAYPVAGFDPARFRDVLRSIPDENGMVFLGRIIMEGMADKAQSADLARIYFFNGTFAYLTTPAACRALIPSLLPLNGHIDHEISTVLIKRRHDFSAYYVEPAFFEPDWSLRSDCYIPLDGEADANTALGQLLTRNRKLLLDEGRLLRAPYA